MPQPNLVSFNIPEDDLAEIEAAIQTLHTKLSPYLIVLSPEDRKEIPRMGDKTFSFVQKSFEYLNTARDQYPELVPPFLDVAEFETDFRGYQKIRSLHQRVAQIDQALLDTMALSGSEAYSASLTYYNFIRYAAKSKIQGAQTIYKDLSASFPRGKRENGETRGY